MKKKFKKTIDKPFSAKMAIGLERGYSKELIPKDDLIGAIQKYQNILILEEGIHLSVLVRDAEIVMSGQIEPHLQLEFINYPKFPLSLNTIKEKIEDLGRLLMNEFNQNRIVIIYDDETVMYEESPEIDPRILIIPPSLRQV